LIKLKPNQVKHRWLNLYVELEAVDEEHNKTKCRNIKDARNSNEKRKKEIEWSYKENKV